MNEEAKTPPIANTPPISAKSQGGTYLNSTGAMGIHNA